MNSNFFTLDLAGGFGLDFLSFGYYSLFQVPYLELLLSLGGFAMFSLRR